MTLPTVYVCITSRDGRVPQRTRDATDAAIRHATTSGVRCLSAVHTGPYGVALCRNAAVAEFLRSKCSHLLFIDDDVTLPVDGITRLAESARQSGKDVVLGCYVGSKIFGDGQARFYVVVLYLNGGPEDCYTSWPDGVVEVSAGGAGCMLIARPVLESVPYPWFRFQGLHVPGAGVVSVGEDIDFCQRVRAAGMRVWADGNVRCGHHKEIDLRQFVGGG